MINTSQNTNQNIGQTTSFHRFIGVDVGKQELVIHDTFDGTSQAILNNSKAINAFFRQHCSTSGTLVVCEATGGYEAALLSSLTVLGIAAHRASANKVKSFIASYGIISKTDTGDAKSIARYAMERHHSLVLWAVPDKQSVQLQELVARRDDLVAIRVSEINRGKAPNTTAPDAAKQVARSIKKTIKHFDDQIALFDKAIAKIIATSQPLKQKFDILTAMDGIGAISAAAILAHLPEIGSLTRRQVASIAGLAPHARDSGQSSGYRAVKGGRKPLRKALFMPAMLATQSRSSFNTTYQNLRQNGKKPLVAITAIMRKIITIANAKIRDEMKIMRQS